jgi:integrase
MDISNKTKRRTYKPRSSAYWQNFGDGRGLGYRKRTSNSAGKWLLRVLETGQTKYRIETIGTADDIAEADGVEVLSFSQAMAIASSRHSVVTEKILVQEALFNWAEGKCRSTDSEKAKADYLNSACRIGSALPQVAINKIFKQDIERWRDSHLDGFENLQPRRSTANRALANLKAALNKAADDANYAGPRPWDKVDKFSERASAGSRDTILELSVEAEIIRLAESDLAILLEAAQLTGARPGELRALSVRDFYGDQLEITTSKTVRRTIPLNEAASIFFANQANGRHRNQPLLPRQDGSRWPEGGHLKPFVRARKRAGLGADVSLYTFRHGFISRFVAKGVPLLAIAKHCGTSVQMIEKNYGKFMPRDMRGYFA